MKFAFMDSETGPEDQAKLERFEPQFTLRNKNDPAKVEAELAEKRAKWYEEAALNPLTGRVLAVGFRLPDGQTYTAMLGDENFLQERDLIEFGFQFLRDAHQGAAYKVVGFCNTSFDVPFWIKRAWALNIAVPPHLVSISGRWLRIPPWLVDLRTLWTFGDKWEPGKLKDLGEFMGVGTKIQEHSENFHELWRDPSTRELGRAHLTNDLDLTEAVSLRMIPTIQPTLENEVQES